MRLAIVAMALSFAVAAPAGHAEATSGPTGPVAETACTNVKIGGQRRCIQRGQYCKRTRAANRAYHRHGLHCGKRDRGGRYHLVSR